MRVVTPEPQAPRKPTQRGQFVTRAGIDVVTCVVALNVAVFLYMVSLTSTGGLLAFIEWGAISVVGLKEGHWWQPVTHLFLHGGDLNLAMRLFHIGLNMLVIYQVGKDLLLDVGSKHWLGIYFLSGILGGFFQILVTPQSPLVGASGAAFGLIGALGTIHYHERLEGWMLGWRFQVYGGSFTRALVVSTAFLGVLALIPGLSLPLLANMGHFAHLGGALGGILYVKLFGFAPKPLTLEALRHERELNDSRLEAQRRTPSS